METYANKVLRLVTQTIDVLSAYQKHQLNDSVAQQDDKGCHSPTGYSEDQFDPLSDDHFVR